MATTTKHQILPRDHPLYEVFSVGPKAPEELQSRAAEAVGWALGDRVTVKGTRGRWENQSGIIEVLNPGDREARVVFDRKGLPPAWFLPEELTGR